VTHGRADVHELLVANDLQPRRALGQNFVADSNTVRRIVRLAGITPGQKVVEVGAGLGSLTLALVDAGASVTAIEIDRAVIPVLRDQVEGRNVRIVEADALTVDWTELLANSVDAPDTTRDISVEARIPTGSAGANPWMLVANLPYNVAVPLVVRVLEEAPQIGSLLVMVQREVGERLAAAPRDEAYGAVSVKVAYWATATVVGRVSPAVFIPRPRVESVLVRLDRRPERLAEAGLGDVLDEDAYRRLFAVVRAGFAHRRKMLRRSLDGLVLPGAFEAASVPPTARAEEIGLDQWTRLAAWQPDTELTNPSGSQGASG
jgi:16S rRNA (adenine1518-N6/adenine1519-N6)-dimethyltransferase